MAKRRPQAVLAGESWERLRAEVLAWACIAVLLFGAASVALAEDAPAAAAPSGAWAGEVTATKLKLRAGPGEAYQEVITLDQGERLVVLGPHANSPEWLKVELPQGYEAWVSAQYLKKGDDGMATVTADRVLVRPRATTRYHQLMGLLDKGESVRVVDSKTTEEGPWFRIVVPRRFPLFTHSAFIRNLGPDLIPQVEAAATAHKPDAAQAAGAPGTDAASAAGPAAVVPATEADRHFAEIERTVRAKLADAKSTHDIEPLRATLDAVDSGGLSRESQERRYVLLTDLVKAERKLARAEFAEAEQRVLSDLEARLEKIQADYEARLQKIRDESDGREEAPRYTATGVVEYRPDLLGRTPSFRLVEAGKMRYFLIATEFELQRFAGKRVGIVGLTDPESGTGHQTLIVKRIEILGEE